MSDVPPLLNAGSYESAGGRGGSGGHGGRGGKGGSSGNNGTEGHHGEEGEAGEPGLPGEVRYYGLTASLASLVPLMLAIIGGIWWIFGLSAEIKSVAKDLKVFSDNVMALNTPLSQRVFSIEARVNDVGRIQSEVRATLAAVDQSGTQQTKVLQRDIAAMKTDIAGQNTRCNDMNVTVARLQQELIETKVRLQYLIEAISPHEQRQRK